jgi:methyl-accepting chemotaxis protein
VVSNDETGQLLQSMEKMLQQFRNTAGVAREISVGNLTVTITPQSEQDVMGNALTAMLASLKTT